MGAFARNIRPHVGAAAKTAFGRVPRGNTGGANVSPFAPMPIPPGRARAPPPTPPHPPPG